MDKNAKSPLIRGKPAWHVRYCRIISLYLVGNVMLLAGQWVAIKWAGFGDLGVRLYSVGMLFWVFGYLVWMYRWGRGYWVSMMRMRNMLIEMAKHRGGASVPCPSCLYPLCDLPSADQEHVCPECGCGIRGADAIRAWDQLRGYETPKAWTEWFFDEENPGW